MGLLSRLEEEIYDYKQRLATVEAVSRNRLETILLIHGCYFDACFEAESILFDLSKAEAERDRLKDENDRLRKTLEEIRDDRSFGDNAAPLLRSIAKLELIRIAKTALREVDGGED